MWGFFFIGAALYLSYYKTQESTGFPSFKSNYFPDDGSIWDHAWRFLEFGYTRGMHRGKQEYPDPLPYFVVNEGNDKLIETNWGYAKHINTSSYKDLLEEKFNIQEHPKLDPSTKTIMNGRKARSQNYFYASN